MLNVKGQCAVVVSRQRCAWRWPEAQTAPSPSRSPTMLLVMPRSEWRTSVRTSSSRFTRSESVYACVCVCVYKHACFHVILTVWNKRERERNKKCVCGWVGVFKYDFFSLSIFSVELGNHRPITMTLNRFEGHRPITMTLNRFEGHRPVTVTLNRFEGHRPITVTLNRFEGHRPITMTLNRFEGPRQITETLTDLKVTDQLQRH